MREAFDETSSYWINSRHEDDGNSFGCLQERACSCAAGCDYDVRVHSEYLGDMLADISDCWCRTVNIQAQVLAFDPAKACNPSLAVASRLS